MTTAAELRSSKSYAARHAAAGLCRNCPRPARPARALCQPCAARNDAAMRRRQARGPTRVHCCSRCGSPNHNARTCWIGG